MFDIPSRLVAAGRPLRPLARRHGAKSAAAPPFLRRVIHSLSPVCTPAHLGSCAPDLRRLVPDRTPDRTEREAAALRSLSACGECPSGCVFSIAPLGPYLNTLSVTFYSQSGHFESIFHHKYADDRKIPQNRPSKFVKNAPALQSAPGRFHSFEYFFQRAALLASNSVRSCTLR